MGKIVDFSLSYPRLSPSPSFFEQECLENRLQGILIIALPDLAKCIPNMGLCPHQKTLTMLLEMQIISSLLTPI